MEVIIDLQQIKSPNDFYNQLTKQVDFGVFFGRNLNAFWDYIGLLEEKKISFINYFLLADNMRDFLIKIISMINEYNIDLIRIGMDSKRLIIVDVYNFSKN